jgi:Ca2+-binding RTX toxin-like protein
MSSIDLVDIAAGTGGFKISGENSSDRAGRSVSAAGDVNGDGFADLIVGAPLNDAGASDTGAAYVVYGAAGGMTSIDLDDVAAGNGGFKILGENSSDQAGFSVSAAGDVNGDGFADLTVGAYLNDEGGSDAGAGYVVFGGNVTGAVTHLGTDAAEVLLGTVGADNINGAQGDDTIIGGLGNDLLAGAQGDDLFVFNDGDGNDTIRDAEVGLGVGDVLDVTEFGFADLTDLLLSSTDVGINVVIALDVDDSVTLLGVNKSQLADDDFLL